DDYLIIWADEDSTDGAFHANFRLDGDGESLHFINAEGEISDELVFGEQEENLGLARIPNGTGPFVIQGQTFGSNNEYVGIDESSVSVEVSAYPVPASVRIHFVAHRAIAQIILADMNGREVLRTNNSHVIEVGNLSEGIYVARVKLNDGTASNIRVVVSH
ncbi:MAG: T9SS type A sorting domain-containing protein, partial [Flavobacteriales bacterium]|nr:T9SS type A sorting domain-containing protein [Flavobacteriales bacterium]